MTKNKSGWGRGGVVTGPHRFVSDVAKEIPDGQVNSGDGLHWQALSAVVDGGPPHLVPDTFDVTRVFAFYEPGEVVLDNEGGWFSANGDTNTFHAVVCLDLDDDGSKGCTPPTKPNKTEVKKMKEKTKKKKTTTTTGLVHPKERAREYTPRTRTDANAHWCTARGRWGQSMHTAASA